MGHFKFVAFFLIMLLASPVKAVQREDAVGLPEPAESSPVENQQILFLNTFQIGLPIPDSIDRGFLIGLRECGGNVSDLVIEHLDFARDNSFDYQTIVTELLRHKLAGKRIGIVIAEGIPAVNFLTTEVKELFPDAPLLTLIAPEISSLTTDAYKVIDIPWKVDAAGTLSMALDLFPETRRVVVITGAHDNILPFLEGAKKAFDPWKGKLDFEYTNEMFYEQMLRRIATLPPDTIIIYAPYFSDKSGRSFVPFDVAVKVGQSANAPVFATLETYLGHGIVGGSLLKTEMMGQQAAKIAFDYLNGSLKLDQPITTVNAFSQKMIDWNELIRWNAKISALPQDSIIINKPLTLQGQYKKEVIAAAVIFVALSVLVLFLLLLNRHLKKLTAKANESEERFKVLHNASFGGIAIHDKGIILDCNRGLSTMTGYSVDELMGMDGLLLIAEKSRDFVMDKILAGYEKPYEAFGLRKTGEEFPMRLEARNIPYKGKTVRTVEFRDITERKQKESEFLKQKLLFETMFNTIPDGVAISNTEREIQLVNQGMKSTFGYEPEDLVGNNAAMLYADSNQYHETGMAVFDQNAEKSESLYVTTYRDKAGREFPGETFGAKLFDETGQWIGNLGIIRDISERKRSEEEQARLQQQLMQAQKMESIGTLAGGIAHDFNNILSSIIGFTELSLDEVQKGTSLEENLQEVYTAGNRAKKLVRQILILSRHDTMEFKTIYINSVVKEAVKMLRSIIPTSITIKENICSRKLVVQADPTQIHQVIVNLITNARHAMSEMGGVLTVNVDSVIFTQNLENKNLNIAPGPYVRISVSDTGIGIAGDLLEKIFEPYFTTREVGKGSGLGLSVVHGIVKSHKGDIEVLSEPGKGTTFDVYLPLSEQQPADLPETDAGPLPTGTERILMVDDEPSVVKMQQHILEKLGYTVTAKTRCVEALEIFRATSDTYDLVITDMTMPDMTGDVFAGEIKKICPDVPIILCTGYSDNIKIRTGSDLQIDSFLIKPVDKRKFATTIRNLLDKSAS